MRLSSKRWPTSRRSLSRKSGLQQRPGRLQRRLPSHLTGLEVVGRMAPPAAPPVWSPSPRPPARAPAAGAPRAGRRRVGVRRAGRVLQAGCAGAGHRSSGCRSCHSRSYAATSVSRSRARRLSSVRGWRFSIISRTCCSCSATSKSCWSQAWWNAIRTLSDSRRVYLPIGSVLRRSWRSWFVTRPSTPP